MSVIEAASAGVKDMADGSLRITFEFEPRFAAEAFALFGPRGRAVAVAALMDGAKAVKEPEPPKEPIGPLCNWLVIRCKEPEFWAWINSTTHDGVMWHVKSEEDAKQFIFEYLLIDSRREIDTDPDVKKKFDELIRHPYQKWLVRRSG